MAELRLSAWLSLAGALVGVAAAGPSTPAVVVDALGGQQVPVGEITGPVAMILAGGMAGRLLNQLVTRLVGWRPHVIVEHRHAAAPPPAPDT